jgi:phage terminase large subunit
MESKRLLQINPTEKQYDAWQALADPNISNIYFGGAAGGGKSWLGCESRLVRAIAYPGYKSFIARNELTRLMASSFVTFTKVCKHHGISEKEWKLNGKYNYIQFANGSRIDLLDLSFKPSDPMYERLGSLEYTDGWIEEAGEIPFMAVDIIQSRVGRHMNVEFGINPDVLYTFNPNKGWVYRIHKEDEKGILPADSVFIRSYYTDNPYTSAMYGKQLDKIKDPAMRARLKEGSFDYDADPFSLIETDSALDLFTNTIDEGEAYLSVDVARHGIDKTVMYIWDGWTIKGVRIYGKQDTKVTSDKVKEILTKRRIAYSKAVADEDGVGGGVVDNNRGIRGFINNASPFINPNTGEKENYANLKAQCAWNLAEKINRHEVAIDVDEGQFRSNIPGMTFEVWKEMLLEELEYVKSKNIDKNSKLQLQSKDDVKKVLGRSPDFSDTMIMRAIFEYKDTKKTKGYAVHRPTSNLLNAVSREHTLKSGGDPMKKKSGFSSNRGKKVDNW